MKSLLFTFLAGGPLIAAAEIMTFEPLPPDFADYSSYLENGIHFGAINGGSEIFHADSLLYYGGHGTGATFFANDGQPLEISLESGGLFDLISLNLDFLTDAAALRVFSSSGAELLLDHPQRATFGMDFELISWARLEFSNATPLDGYAAVDNLVVQAVPEGSAGGAGLAVGGMVWLVSRRRARTQSR